MRRSSRKILTTHVGSLPGLSELDRNGPSYERDLQDAVAKIVELQRSIGIDVINEGEYTKGADWLSYLEHRFDGFEQEPASASAKPVILQGKDREDFADFYQWATERGTLAFAVPGKVRPPRPAWRCVGPIQYAGHAALQRELDLLSAHAAQSEVFLTSTAPASLEPYWHNAFYPTQEAFLFALADALRTEYEAIVDAGFVLQVDDAWLPAMWDRIGMAMGLEAFKTWCLVRVEALNHALRNIPEDRIRYHLCWGSWHGPHAYDLEMRHLVDVMLRVKAQAYLFEAANPRHEHEFAVWQSVRLPEGKIIIPGVVTHSTDIIEHPELVSLRIQRFANLVGKENVIAGTDCGFGGRTHPQIAWAKLIALVAGAKLATEVLKFA